MNAQRRRHILRAVDLIEGALQILQEVTEEEAEAFDNMPEPFQDGPQGEQMQEYISALEDAARQLEEAAEVAENCGCTR